VTGLFCTKGRWNYRGLLCHVRVTGSSYNVGNAIPGWAAAQSERGDSHQLFPEPVFCVPNHRKIPRCGGDRDVDTGPLASSRCIYQHLDTFPRRQYRLDPKCQLVESSKAIFALQACRRSVAASERLRGRPETAEMTGSPRPLLRARNGLILGPHRTGNLWWRLRRSCYLINRERAPMIR
jgi:hypothetical protein